MEGFGFFVILEGGLCGNWGGIVYWRVKLFDFFFLVAQWGFF